MTGLRSFDEHVDDWQALHDGIEPRGPVIGYLKVVHAFARPLAARRVPPDLVTALAVVAGVGVLLAARADLLVVAAVLLVVTALLDGLDGAVAVLSSRVSSYGRSLDLAADRLVEVLWLCAAVAVGCPVWLAVLAGAVIAALEGWRVVLGRVGRVTAAERPTRVIVLTPALALGGDGCTALVAVLVGLTLGGLTQLALALRTPAPES